MTEFKFSDMDVLNKVVAKFFAKRAAARAIENPRITRRAIIDGDNGYEQISLKGEKIQRDGFTVRVPEDLSGVFKFAILTQGW